MAVFPPGTSFLAPPSAIHSLGQSPSATVPVVSSEYPLTHLTDGTLARACRFAFGTVQITVPTASCTPTLFGVLNHNLDPGQIIGVSNGAGLNRGFGVRDPSCWIDLRGFPTTASSWTLTINSNSVPVSIGEIVVATAVEFEGIWELEFSEEVSYPGYRDRTEYQKLYLSASGAMVRALPLRARVSTAQQAELAAIFAEANSGAGRVLVVPSTRINDIWFVDWPSVSEFTFPNVAEVTLPLAIVDEGGGVLLGR